MPPTHTLSHMPTATLLQSIPRTNNQKVFELAATWEQAYKFATKSSTPPRKFFSKTPWQSHIKMDQTRWQSFVKLNEFLRTQRIPVDEFCAAVAEYFAHVIKRRPNPYQVAGPWGIGLWQSWRGKKVFQGNQTNQGLSRVRAAAIREAGTPQASLHDAIMQAYSDCKQFGADDAPSPMWGPDVIWLFMATEPSTQAAIQRLLDTTANPEYWEQALQAIQHNPLKRRELLTLRLTITKTTDPILRH